MSAKVRDWLAQAFEMNRKIDEQEKKIIDLESALKDKDRMLSTMKQSNIIQIGVLVVIGVGAFVGFVLNRYAIAKQGEYNSNLIRPYVYPVPSQTIERSRYTIYSDYDFVCEGMSPAYNVESYHVYTTSAIFPVRKKDMKCDSISLGFFPLNTSKEFDGFYVDTVKIDLRSIIPWKQQIMSKINADSLYLHIYVEYCDCNENMYSIKCSFLPKNVVEISDVKFKCDWHMVYAVESHLD